ncbi:MAG: helix-turn-helix domain-containing protein [Chthoniobacterales bacterium]|nr:helix-turn-helix domain-containing protein [Chthoniobacterales bacterium]
MEHPAWLPYLSCDTKYNMTTLDLRCTPERHILDLRKLDLPGARVLGRYRYSYPHRPLPPHRHPGMIEICYLHRGRQIYDVEGQTFVIHGGEFFVTLPGERHSTGADPEDRGVLYWMILSLTGNRGPFLGQTEGIGRQISKLLAKLPRRQFAAPKSTQRTLEQLLKFGEAKPGILSKISARVIALDFLLSVIHSSKRQMERESPAWLPKVLQHIDHSFADNPQVPELAEVAGLSVSRFKLRFREITGVAPAEFVLRKRLAEAERLLTTTGMPITKIAFDLGFSSSQGFATAFRRMTNRRPRDLRAGDRS